MIRAHTMFWIAALGLACAPAWASDGEIGVYFTEDGAGDCHQTIPCGETRTLYVLAQLGGASAAGITGAEFGMQIGLDEYPDTGWAFEETFAPGVTISLGSGAFTPADNGPIDYHGRRGRGRGVNASWAECQTGPLVLIETVDITNLGCSEQELRLLVVSHDRPSNQFFQCPLFVVCDAPIYTKVCLGRNLTPCRNPEPPFAENAVCSTSGEAVINPSADSITRPCRVTAIEPSSWSAVKRLFR